MCERFLAKEAKESPFAAFNMRRRQVVELRKRLAEEEKALAIKKTEKNTVIKTLNGAVSI